MDALATSKTNADLQNPTKIETLLKSRAIQEVQDRSSVRVNPISVAEDIKRRWKATMTQVADKQRQQTALGYRWNLTAEERDGRAKERQRSMRSLKKPSICGTVEPADLSFAGPPLRRKGRTIGIKSDCTPSSPCPPAMNHSFSLSSILMSLGIVLTHFRCCRLLRWAFVGVYLLICSPG